MVQRKQPERKAGKCGHTSQRQEEGQITRRDGCGRSDIRSSRTGSVEGGAIKDL